MTRVVTQSGSSLYFSELIFQGKELLTLSKNVHFTAKSLSLKNVFIKFGSNVTLTIDKGIDGDNSRMSLGENSTIRSASTQLYHGGLSLGINNTFITNSLELFDQSDFVVSENSKICVGQTTVLSSGSSLIFNKNISTIFEDVFVSHKSTLQFGDDNSLTSKGRIKVSTYSQCVVRCNTTVLIARNLFLNSFSTLTTNRNVQIQTNEYISVVDDSNATFGDENTIEIGDYLYVSNHSLVDVNTKNKISIQTFYMVNQYSNVSFGEDTYLHAENFDFSNSHLNFENAFNGSANTICNIQNCNLSFKDNAQILVEGNTKQVCKRGDKECHILSIDSQSIFTINKTIKCYPVFILLNGQFNVGDGVTINSVSNESFDFIATRDVHSDIQFGNFTTVSEGKVLRYQDSNTEEVYCYMNGTSWRESNRDNTLEIDVVNTFSFVHQHCPCYGEHCHIINLMNDIYISDHSIHSTFENKATLHFEIETEKIQKVVAESIAAELFTTVWVSFPEYSIFSFNMNKTIQIDDYTIQSPKKELKREAKQTKLTFSNIDLAFSTTKDLFLSTKLPTQSQLSESGNTVVLASSFYVTVGDITCQAAIVDNNITKCLIQSPQTCPPNHFYNDITQRCDVCSNNCKQCLNQEECHSCEDNFVLQNKFCVHNEKCLLTSASRCWKCSEGNVNTNCDNCDLNCFLCEEECQICANGYIKNGSKCVIIDHSISVSQSGSISCVNGFFNTEGICQSCSIYGEACLECQISGCELCDTGYVISNGRCVLSHCLTFVINLNTTENRICQICEPHYTLNINGKCEPHIENCEITNEGNCVVCSYPFVNNNGTCVSRIDNCEQYSNGFCVRCIARYYINDLFTCSQCLPQCNLCSNKRSCDLCESNYLLYDGQCKDSKLIGCSVQLNSKCVQCEDGYFKDKDTCMECSLNCQTCLNNNTCILCDSDFVLTDSNTCRSKIESNCDEIINSQCLTCASGFYLEQKECKQCGPGCSICNSFNQCQACLSTFVYSNGKCDSLNLINNCISIENSECVSCSFLYKANKTYCSQQLTLTEFVLILVVCLLFVVLIIMTILFVIVYFTRPRQRSLKNYIFDMKTTTLNFSTRINSKIVLNKSVIELGKLTDLEATLESVLCVGNTYPTPQLVSLELSEYETRFSLRVTPSCAILKKGEACEFHIEVFPLTECTYSGVISVVDKDIETNQIDKGDFFVFFEESDFIHINPLEIQKQCLIGEGVYGDVFRAFYKGSEVALKRMKNLKNENYYEEFGRQVRIINQMKSPYVIGFYGIVVGETYSVVSEYSVYGSVYDAIKKGDILREKLKTKILIDSGYALMYLHNHNIIHGDFKTSNILIMNKTLNGKVNAKICDFVNSIYLKEENNQSYKQSSIIGNSAYCAPEIYEKKSPSKKSDVFAYGMVLYETFSWKLLYQQFEHVMDIQKYVCEGKRLEIIDEINRDQYELITKCWGQNPEERIDIEKAVQNLKDLN
ncbi:serine-threonine protein kinase, putative [Entamoeba invadens IP1]|uniref:serine-threonine protein kinase, putative n=1 Tax=Entamoeba invadens IP1 TaxID=370355 RepID=UPI0002C3D868|nr:serine-threonine protein kinase, putative [Entamoeba invadens IP1]ELP93541.1 serine-threonine protein kinase, putative [Entamoeba invadens IP1]|eukprot:XP_004260312.1 serine-threonine protein kinase, putative [Entamoeba invadens IP1]